MLFIVCALLALLLFVVGIKSGKQQPQIKFGAIIAGIVLLLIGGSEIVTVVPAGHVGVVDLFGNVSTTTLKPGVNLVNPLARVIHFTVKTQEFKDDVEVPSKEGLSVKLEISVLFHMDSDKADELYKGIGENYIEVILKPFFRSVIRGVTAEYDAKALYTSKRELLAQRIQDDLAKKVAPRGIVIEGTPLRKVMLPEKLTESIEEKLRAEQESQRMEFVLTKEKQEADRKRLEAQGIADFQKIVSEGINENLLKWKGIEATEKLASSNNAKVVVIGSGKDGLPLILGQ